MMRCGIVLAIVIFSLVSLQHCKAMDVPGFSNDVILHMLQSLRNVGTRMSPVRVYVPSNYQQEVISKLNNALGPVATVSTVGALGISGYCIVKCADCPQSLYAIVHNNNNDYNKCGDCVHFTVTVAKAEDLFVAKLSDLRELFKAVDAAGKCFQQVEDP